MTDYLTASLCMFVLATGCQSAPPVAPPAPPPPGSRSDQEGGIADQDGDGVADANDACPANAGKRPDGCPTADRAATGDEARKAFEALLVRRASPDYFVSDAQVLAAIDALRDADPTELARVRAIFAEKQAAGAAITQAEQEERAASHPAEVTDETAGRLIDAKLALHELEKAYADVSARLDAALQKL